MGLTLICRISERFSAGDNCGRAMRFFPSSWGLGGGARPLNQSFCMTKTYLATLTLSNLYCKKSIRLWIIGGWSHWLLPSPP